MADIRFPIEGVSYPSSEDAARYRKGGGWVEATAGDVLRATAKRLPDKVAIISEGRRMTFAEFDACSEKLGAALIQLGFRPGDRALFQMGSVHETAVALFACFKAGIVPVCSLPQFREIEMAELARQSEAKAWFVQADFGAFDLVGFVSKLAAEFPAVRDIVVARGPAPGGMQSYDALIASQTLEGARAILARQPIGIEDVISFQLSGGTTGTPKIIPLFHGGFLGYARDWARRNGMDANLVSLYALPLIHHAGQICSLLPVVMLGGTQVLMQRMDPALFFDWVARERVTHSLCIGPAAAHMIEYADVSAHDLSSIKLLTVFNRADLLQRHLKVPCANMFGLTEGGFMCSEPDAPPEARFGTVGRPYSDLAEMRLLVPGLEREVAFGEIGELCIKGPATIRGYFRLPQVNRVSFTADGFFRTGDLMKEVRIGEQINYIFTGRIKDNIDRGGEKFGAEELENLIVRHPQVADAKVVAMPDKVYGEKACAFLIMHPGKPLLTVSELGAFLLAQGLAKFKLPERIEGIDTFPTTRVGKLDKAMLRKMIADKLAQEES